MSGLDTCCERMSAGSILCARDRMGQLYVKTPIRRATSSPVEHNDQFEPVTFYNLEL